MSGEHSPYRMPFWPLPPLAALAAFVYVTFEQSLLAWAVAAATAIIALIYYIIYLWPRRNVAWRMILPTEHEEEAEPRSPATTELKKAFE